TSAQVGTLTATRYFRAVVTNGTCTPINSGIITVTVDNPSAMGAVSANQTICSGSSPANMTIASATGTIQWQRADDLAFTTNVTNVGTNATTLTSAQVGTLNATRYFRAVVTNGTCTPINSAPITVTVDTPSAVGAVSANQTICSGSSPANMTIASATGTIQWQRADNLAFTTNVTSVGTNSTTLTSVQVGALPATRYFRAVVANGTCTPVNSAIITVTVNPTPELNNIALTACTDVAFDIIPVNGTNGLVPAGTTYTWNAPTVTGGITGGAAGSGVTSISGTLSNIGNTPQTATYTVTPVANGCTGTAFTITVTVNPNTEITTQPDTGNYDVCFGDGFSQISVSATGAGTLTYQWFRNTTNSNSGGTAVPGATSATFTPPSTPVSFSYYYVEVTGTCGTVTSNPTGSYEVFPPITVITLNPSTTSQTTCSGVTPFSAINVAATGAGTITYQWYSNTSATNIGGTLISGATNPTFTPPNTTVGTLYYYATGKSDCGTVPTNVSGAFTVTPLTEITEEDLGGEVICDGDTFDPISVTAIGTGNIEYQWYSNTTNSTSGPNVTMVGTDSNTFTPPASPLGTLYYFVVVSSDCGPDDTSIVSGAFTVNPLPTPTFSEAPAAAVCVGASVTYTTQGGQSNYIWSGFGTVGTDYNITSGGIGTSDNSVTVTWLSSGTKNISVRYTDPNGCLATTSATNSLVVNPLPTPTFTTSPSAPVCVGTPVTYTTQNSQTNYNWSVSGVAGTDYTITSGGIGSTNSTVTLTWLTSGSKNVTVSYTNSNNCTATSPASNTLTVNPLPIPTFTTSPNSLVCLQQGVTYTTQSGKSNYVWSIPGTASTDYTITSGGIGSGSSTVTLQWLTTGSKNVTVRYTEPTTGCVATANASSTTTVEPFATVGLPSTNFPTVCLSSPTLPPFTQSTTGVTGIGTVSGLPAGVTAIFNTSTGNIEFSGSNVTAPAGLYSYTITLNGNCINGLTATGTIHVVPTTYDITAISSVSATTIPGKATVFFFGNSSTMINGTYNVSYEIKQADGTFSTPQNTTATVTDGRGIFNTVDISSNTDTYTVRIISLKRTTDLCTTTFAVAERPITYFGICSAVYGGNSTFTVPANVFSITIEVYGGGGGGNSHGGGGGGYSIRQNISVVPGEPLGIFVGAGGGNGVNGGTSYVTRDSSDPNTLPVSLVYATGGNGGNSANSAGGIRDPRFNSGSNGASSNGTNGGNAGGPLGGAAGGDGVNGSSPGGGGGKKAGNRGIGGNGLVIISYSCPDADNTDCIKVIDDGSKSGVTVLEFKDDCTWTAPEGLSEFTVYVGSGGGGGGSGEGSGGGGSGSLIRQTFTSSNPFGLPAGSVFQITVGQGGQGAQTVNANGFQGGTSTFTGIIDGNNENISVPGGGGGGSQSTNAGGNGASGGGGGASPNPSQTFGVGGNTIPITYTGTNVTVYQGNIGGRGDYSAPQNSVAGGGGGGLIPWGNGNDGQNGKAAGNGQGEGGRGGDGRVLTLGDSLRYFGAGGGGIGRFFNGTDKIGLGGTAGGVRIGGSGNLSGTNPVGRPGTDKTGSGGGAGYFGGGRGGNGVVYITYFNFSILNVEYEHFTATYNPQDRSGDLTWTTSNEWETSHFEIERAVNNVNTWTKVGEVEGAGYSDAPIDYAFTDTQLPATGGNIFYRLKQVGIDGDFDYSVTRSIQVNPIKGNTTWIGYPNPSDLKSPVTVALLDVSGYTDGTIQVRISDIRGVFTTYSVSSPDAVSNVVNTHLENGRPGMYILQLLWGNQSEQLKLIKK
ncbi:MAG: glycine-rich domain-containing protein, partial [Bacteroidia bacterium]